MRRSGRNLNTLIYIPVRLFFVCQGFERWRLKPREQAFLTCFEEMLEMWLWLGLSSGKTGTWWEFIFPVGSHPYTYLSIPLPLFMRKERL